MKILFGFCFIACASYQQPTDLYQHWIHSHEEDSTQEGYRTYRPATYDFPPARGRDGFEIKANGIAIDHPIAPSDGNESIEKKWRLRGDELILEDKKKTSRFQVISMTREKLVVKLLSPKE